MVFLKNVLIWWLYLKTDPMNCNRLNRRRRRQRRQRCAEVSHHEFETTKGFGTILSGLARSAVVCFFHPVSCLHTFLIVLGISEVSCFMIHFLYNDGWVQFSSMQELQVPHLHEQADLGIFFSRTVLKIAGFYRFPGTLSHWIPSFTEIFRERWFPSDSDDDFGSDFFFILKFWHVLTISSKLGYFQMVPWSEIGPPKKGPDVMDSRDLNRNPFSLVIFGDLFGWYPAW